MCQSSDDFFIAPPRIICCVPNPDVKSCIAFLPDTPPKSNIDTKSDALEMYLLSNMPMFGIYVKLHGVFSFC